VTDDTSYDMNMILFTQLLMSFQASAMQQMGKIMNPFTQKIERDLSQAKMSIDMLAMIEEKTKGNLKAEEAKLLERILFELHMNYVDEVDKEKKKAAEEKTEKDVKDEDGAGSEEKVSGSENDSDSAQGSNAKDVIADKEEKVASDGDEPNVEAEETDGKASKEKKVVTKKRSAAGTKKKTDAKSKSKS